MEITIPDPLESIIDAYISPEHIKIHRLFYVDHSHSTIDDEYKIAADSQSISKVTTALRTTTHCFEYLVKNLVLKLV